jgi:hypothetical protein
MKLINPAEKKDCCAPVSPVIGEPAAAGPPRTPGSVCATLCPIVHKTAVMSNIGKRVEGVLHRPASRLFAKRDVSNFQNIDFSLRRWRVWQRAKSKERQPGLSGANSGSGASRSHSPLPKQSRADA